jgi:hypothetical protein
MPPHGPPRSFLSALLEAPGKRRAIRRYLTVLPGRLRRDYGYGGPYTPEQVRATIARHKLSSQRHLAYAVALFCDPGALARFRRQQGDHGDDASGPRRELAQRYFGGDMTFTPETVVRHFGQHEVMSGETGGGHHAALSHDDGGHGHP